MPLKIYLFDYGIKLEEGKVWKLKVSANQKSNIQEIELYDITFNCSENNIYVSYDNLPPIFSADKIILYKLPKGTYFFKFQKEGYEDEIKKIIVNNSQVINIKLTPNKFNTNTLNFPIPGIILISSEPSGAELLINGKVMGNTPFQADLLPGEYKIEIRKPYYHSEIFNIKIEEAKTTSIKKSLKLSSGYISIISPQTNELLKCYIDGKYIGLLPIDNYQLERGPHSISVENELFHNYKETIIVEDGVKRTIPISLKPNYGRLNVTSYPVDGADVFLDNDFIGKTPLVKDKIKSGFYILKLKKEFYSDFEEKIEIKDNETTLKNIILKKNYGKVRIRVPEQSSLYLNNNIITENDLTLLPGEYTFTAKKYNHYPDTKTINLNVGDEIDLELYPKPIFGGLTVMVINEGAIFSDVFIDSKYYGKTPFVTKLPIGNYDLLLRKENYIDYKTNFSILENKTTKLEIFMKPYGNDKRFFDFMKWAGFTATVSSLALAGNYYYYAEKNYNNYKKSIYTNSVNHFKNRTIQFHNNQNKFLRYAVYTAAFAFLNWIISNAI
ncbi:MAG TPA: PEGA domain-containing protein [Ignavibacteriales bacterium]|mgnify:CR=1 FL=1|nr:PEGA domain-containing protein [Ignavibacteriales bacterium]